MNRCHHHMCGVNPLWVRLWPRVLVLAWVWVFTLTPVSVQSQSNPNPTPIALSRILPPASLRGELLIKNAQWGKINGNNETLAPGLRVRGPNNLLLAPSMLMGKKFVVNYVRDSYGLVFDVWILRDDELAKRWPKTLQEAATWRYDPYTQAWTKP